MPSQPERAEDRTSALRRHFHPEDDFGGFTELDGAIRFYARVRELLAPDGVALDIGCGRGTQAEDPVRVRRELRILRGHCRRVIGIDVDPIGAENQFIDEFRSIGPDLKWPVDDDGVDLAVADFVVEHVADPGGFFAEAARVIKPGGYLCIRTINVHSYLGMASRLVPSRLHAATLKRAQPVRQSQDVFPTVYRCNSRKRLAAALDAHGFDGAVYTSEDEPAYLTFSPLAYRLGLAHRRFAPRGMLIGLLAWGRRRS
ncbi:MAG: class I SAM-dependent methyltransferase [Solirubrobacteraceae bacterium]